MLAALTKPFGRAACCAALNRASWCLLFSSCSKHFRPLSICQYAGSGGTSLPQLIHSKQLSTSGLTCQIPRAHLISRTPCHLSVISRESMPGWQNGSWGRSALMLPLYTHAKQLVFSDPPDVSKGTACIQVGEWQACAALAYKAARRPECQEPCRGGVKGTSRAPHSCAGASRPGTRSRRSCGQRPRSPSLGGLATTSAACLHAPAKAEQPHDGLNCSNCCGQHKKFIALLALHHKELAELALTARTAVAVIDLVAVPTKGCTWGSQAFCTDTQCRAAACTGLHLHLLLGLTPAKALVWYTVVAGLPPPQLLQLCHASSKLQTHQAGREPDWPLCVL